MGSVHSQNSDMEAEAKRTAIGARRNNSDTSVLSTKSTITFEKRKVPPRGRTHSVQSVFSSMSLKSMLQNVHGTAGHNIGPEQEAESKGEPGGSGHSQIGSGGSTAAPGSSAGPHALTSVVTTAQQIQSPAIASSNLLRRRTTKTSKASSKDIIDEHAEDEIKIGERLPFTDEQQVHPDHGSQAVQESNQSNSSTTTVSSAAPEDSSTTPQKLGETPISGHSSINRHQLEAPKMGQPQQEHEPMPQHQPESLPQEVTEDEFTEQKQLTRDALRKLSMLQANKASVSAGSTLNENQRSVGANENLNEPQEPLTHLHFGGKHVILETSRKNHIPFSSSQIMNNAHRSSVSDFLIQPEALKVPGASQTQYNINKSSEATYIRENGVGTEQHRYYTKKPIRQINEPKKPMYTPAVLRDISETNLTWNQLKAHSPSPSATSVPHNNGLYIVKSGHSNSASSIHSTGSSFLSDYRRKFDMWLGYGKCPNQPMQRVNLVPPTRKHWVSDNKRQACRYCHKLFTFWERKHHCRHCGDIFCQQHVRHWLYLNPKAKFIIGGGGLGMLSKICDNCLEEYERLVKDGPNGVNTGTGSPSNIDSPGNVTPRKNYQKQNSSNPKVSAAKINGVAEGDEVQPGTSGRQRLDSFVGSIPADWSWSSF
ncbi:FAFR490Cp [Eremothecium gossypii FDAG1]|nr:FAFR490Cp [Eremothecium gossypii FDAG1]